MLLSALTTGVALLASAHAAALPSPQGMATPPSGTYPSLSTARNFRLIANISNPEPVLDIAGYRLGSYHLGAGIAAAVLWPVTETNVGRQFYVNGTVAEVHYRRGSLASSGGTPPLPQSLILPPPGVASADKGVQLNFDAPTLGVQLNTYPAPISQLVGPGNGVYYGCNNTALPYGPAVQLYFDYSAEAAVPEGCEAVTLLPQCSEGDGVEKEWDSEVRCYADVGAIEWAGFDTE